MNSPSLPDACLLTDQPNFFHLTARRRIRRYVCCSFTSQRGHTLLELLIATSIIGILMAIVMPAIANVRESARSMKCLANLKQLGVAASIFHDISEHFPSGRGTPLPAVFSAQAYLAPFCEPGNQTFGIDFSAAPVSFETATQSYSGEKNEVAAKTRLTSLLCPSDQHSNVPGSAFGATNYVACAGSGNANRGSLNGSDGIYFTGSMIRRADLLDGASHTAAFSERTLGPGDVTPSIVISQSGLIREVPLGVPVNIDSCDSSRTGVWLTGRGEKWILGNYGNTLYSHFKTPNSKTSDCISKSQQEGWLTARSTHPSGVHLLFADGRADFVHETIDLRVWQSRATRAGGEPISE